eukprot:c389_g1_i2.p1 GENE.c389_g1_i2~~c389_g1_i2.p1  ORF type:complete len:114 (+),score=29.04 c389_g1_i2:323-664(+)
MAMYNSQAPYNGHHSPSGDIESSRVKALLGSAKATVHEATPVGRVMQVATAALVVSAATLVMASSVIVTSGVRCSSSLPVAIPLVLYIIFVLILYVVLVAVDYALVHVIAQFS